MGEHNLPQRRHNAGSIITFLQLLQGFLIYLIRKTCSLINESYLLNRGKNVQKPEERDAAANLRNRSWYKLGNFISWKGTKGVMQKGLLTLLALYSFWKCRSHVCVEDRRSSSLTMISIGGILNIFSNSFT